MTVRTVKSSECCLSLNEDNDARRASSFSLIGLIVNENKAKTHAVTSGGALKSRGTLHSFVIDTRGWLEKRIHNRSISGSEAVSDVSNLPSCH